MIFGIDETEKFSDTIDVLKDLLENKCHYNPSHLDLNSKSAHRVGAKQNGKNRPIRLSLDTEATKWELLKRLNAQKISGVFGRLDLTKEKQERDFQLRQELKKKREEQVGKKFKILKNQIVEVPLENAR